MIYPQITKIIYCYSEFKPSLEWGDITTYSKGYSEDLISRDKLQNHRTLLVIDDLSDEVDADEMTRLFTKLSHHRSISVLFLVQNLFYKGLRSMRTVSMNALYTIVFKSARDSQVETPYPPLPTIPNPTLVNPQPYPILPSQPYSGCSYVESSSLPAKS